MFENLTPDQMDTLHTIFSVVSLIMGGMIGSFLNVCVYRLPEGLSVVKPRSRCPKCETPIAWYDNLPVISWILLRAKCRQCKAPISWQYPLVEAITGILFLLVFLKFGFTLASPIYMILVAALVLVTFVDLTDWTIPNEVTFPGMPLGIVCALVAMMVPESGLLLDDPIMAIAGLFAGGGLLYGLDMVSLLVLKKRGMGFGDVKLLAMLGAFFGLWGVFLIIILASFSGSAIGIPLIMAGRKQTSVSEDNEKENIGHYLPFGPCIVLGGIVYLFYGPQIIQTYLSYINVPGAM